MMKFLALAMVLPPVESPAVTSAPPPPPPPPCSSVEHAQFDFWLGDWDVYLSGSETLMGTSKVERLFSGCAVRETWLPSNGMSGGSLNNFDPGTKRWSQTWVGSSPGPMIHFEGGLVGSSMILMGNWPHVNAPQQIIRMTFTPNADGSVRQHGEASWDHGLTWKTSFDFIYRPKKEPSK